jgi:hypothetical protein
MSGATKTLFALLVGGSLLLPACQHEPPVIPEVVDNGGGGGGPLPISEPCDSDTVYFAQSILPLIVSNCAGTGCHDAITHESGVRLYDYAHIMQEVSPGNPNNSNLLTDGIWQTGDNAMPPPPNPALTTAQEALIVIWIQQGAQNNSCTGGCDTSNVTFSGTIAPMVQTNCAGGSCHDASSPAANLNLTTYAGVAQIANNGSLAGSIQHQSPYVSMPPGLWLSQCQINQVLIWVQAGSPNN